MKAISKAMVALFGAAVGFGFAGTASATVSTVNANQVNELTLWVFDQQTDKSYLRDLGISVNNFLNTSAIVPQAGTYAFNPDGVIPLVDGSVNALGYQLVFSPDPLLTSFFSNDELTRAKYQVIGARGPNAQAGAVTTSNSASLATTNGNLRNFDNQIDNALTGGNVLGTHPGTVARNGSSATDNPAEVSNVGKIIRNNFGSFASFTTDASVGTPLSFHQISASSNAAGSLANVTEFAGTWNLATDGTLTYAVPVPEPEAYALMLAGLGLVVAFARRRRQG